MKILNKNTAPKMYAPERVIQFGEGNFLRAFVDWIVNEMDEKTSFNGSVVIVQPRERNHIEPLEGAGLHVPCQPLRPGRTALLSTTASVSTVSVAPSTLTRRTMLSSPSLNSRRCASSSRTRQRRGSLSIPSANWRTSRQLRIPRN